MPRTKGISKKSFNPTVKVRVFKSFPDAVCKGGASRTGTETVDLITEVPLDQVGFTYVQLQQKLQAISRMKSLEYQEALTTLRDRDNVEESAKSALELLKEIERGVIEA